jgi:8-oxo-dGTP pyrophosphatase MutT (NUDIX family)
LDFSAGCAIGRYDREFAPILKRQSNNLFMARRRPMPFAYAQRPFGFPYGGGAWLAGLSGLWVLPAGRVEDGESFEEALQREMQEESGLTVTIDQNLGERLQHLTDATVTLNFFRCRAISNVARPGDDLELVTWLSKPDAYARLAPAVKETFPFALAEWFED